MTNNLNAMFTESHIRQEFGKLDRDRSGSISLQEATKSFNELRCPQPTAKLLLESITDSPEIDFLTFKRFYSHLQSFKIAFDSTQRDGKIDIKQLVAALDLLDFPPINASLLHAIQIKFDPNKNGIEFGEFVSICSYLLLCNKLVKKYDRQGLGRIEVDFNGVGCLGMWFL